MKKAKRWVAAVLAASMVFSQTVYAQEYTAEESTAEMETTVDESAAETEESSVAIEETGKFETESMEETVSSTQQDSTEEETDASDSETAVVKGADTSVYVGEKSATISLDSCSISISDKYVAYDGKPKTPAITIMNGNTKLVAGKDYTVSYKNNQNVGTASATIKGNGTTYSGEKTLEFQIVNVTETLKEGENYIKVDTNEGNFKLKFSPEKEGYYHIGFVELDSCFDVEEKEGFSTFHADDLITYVPTTKLFTDKIYVLEITSDEPTTKIIKVVIEQIATKGEVDGVTWDFNDDGTLYINGNNNDLYWGIDRVDGCLWECFKGDTKKVIIGDKVTHIPHSAFFRLKQLESIELPDGLEWIDNYAFAECEKLSRVILPENLEHVGYCAFEGCGFKSIKIPESVTYIQSYAFGYDVNEELIDGFYIIGTKGSEAETYATENGITFLTKDSHEHTIVKDLAIAATTEQPGKTEGSHCSECGEILTPQETTVVTTPLIEAKADDKGGITVSWKKVGYAEGYTVYRKNSSNEEWQRVADVKGKDTASWTDTTGEMCTAYTYTVSAYMNENGKTITGDFDSKGVTVTVLPAVVVLKNAVDNGKNGVDVTWEKVTGATGYRIYRKTADTGWKGLATVKPDSTTTYTDTSAVPGTNYTYTVRAYKTVNGKDVYGGFDTTGVSASVKKNDQALGTVVLDKAVDSTRGGIILSWKAVDGAENYRIFKKFSGGSWQKVTDVTADKLSYEDPTGVTGKTYTYTVRAFKKVNGKEVFGGFDSKGLTATKLPAKVTLKEAKVNVDGTITVSWNKMSTATGYRVFRKEAGGSWKGLITLTSNTATNYTDKNVEEGKSYTYTVRAYKVYDGKTVYGSFDANGKTAAVPVNMLSTVKLVSAAASSGRKITVSWENVDNCQGYIVYRKEAGKGWVRLAKAAGSSLTSYTDASGAAGTNYTYTVRAYKIVKGKEVLGGFDTKGVSAQCKN